MDYPKYFPRKGDKISAKTEAGYFVAKILEENTGPRDEYEIGVVDSSGVSWLMDRLKVRETDEGVGVFIHIDSLTDLMHKCTSLYIGRGER